MPKTAINLYSVRALEEPTIEVIERVADAGYDGVQFAGEYSPLHDDRDAIVETLEARDLEVVPPHVDIETLENEFAAVREAYEPLGVDAAVVPWLDPERFESAAAVDETVARIDALEGDLADEGWDLHYHNHDHEYVDLGGASAFERFVDATDVGIELDVGWALAAGDDPVERIRALDDRAKLIHAKDMDTSADPGFVEIGEGDVDMRACAEAAEEVDADWLVYEHDDPADPAASIEHGAAFLDDL